jgi:glutamyl-tRNA reductase
MSSIIDKAILQIKNGKDANIVLDEFSKKLLNVLVHPIRQQIKTGDMEYRNKLKLVLDEISLDKEDSLM